jgi:MazG family protein
MQKLRDPESGCPWDLEQTFKTIIPHTIEEAYEVADTIERNDLDNLKYELGDLLFQIIFYAQLAQEENRFSFEDIAEAMAEKLIRRHPHVFGDKDISTADAQTASWEAIKAEERAAKAQNGLLDDIPHGLPALTRAQKLQKRAAKVGFDWPEIAPVIGKLKEELFELEEAVQQNNPEHITEEIGDTLFAFVNLARHLQVDSESALRGCNQKFEERFRYIEEHSKKPLDATSLEEMEALWNEAKQKSRK